MNGRKFRLSLTLSVLFLLLSAGLIFNHLQAKSDDFYESIIRFDDIIRKIKTHYVVDVPAETLITYAVGGMTQILDPHTNYFEEEEYNNLMIQTKGEFGGLGIQIGIRDRILTVIAPMPNTPAMKMGLLAGDRIVKIEGKPTAGIKLDEAVNKLRGQKGTDVTISIGREGTPEPFDVTLTRDIIKIQSVPYFGMVDKENKIGYVKLLNFTETSDQEMEDAIVALKKEGLKAMVLDLRGNPGGLLKQAVKVAEKFLPSGKMVVYTKGRGEKPTAEFVAGGSSVVPASVPIVVLVSQGSASASEIVAGAIQDHDRGVILGNETFGKGSVQTILPLEKRHALKLTTAYYYTPSGRCINRPDNEAAATRHEREKHEEEEDAQAGRPDSVPPKREEFRTLNEGRVVYGGGGISPDVDVTPERYGYLEMQVIRKSLFFKFAVAEVAHRKAKNQPINEATFKVTDALYDEFLSFLKKENFQFQSPEELILGDFKKSLDADRRDPRDTSKVIPGPNDKALDETVSSLEKAVEKDKEFAFQRYKDVFKERLTLEFLSVGSSQDAWYRFALKNDHALKEALLLLGNKQQYKTILSKDFKKQPLKSNG